MKRGRNDDDDGRPTKRYRRTYVDVSEKRFPWIHNEVSYQVCNMFSLDDLTRLTEERDITDIRYDNLGREGRDGLDDASTPSTTPTRTRITQVEFDFAAE